MKKWILLLNMLLMLTARANASGISGYCGPKDENGDYGTNCQWNYDFETKTLKISGTGDMYNTPDTYDYPWSKGTSYYNDIENVVIEEGITRIGQHAFMYAKGLKNIVLPNSLEDIYANALNGGTQLTSIIIPDSVKRIIGSEKFPPFDSTITELYCSEAQQNMCRQALKLSGLDEGVLKTYQKYGSSYYYDGKFYVSPKDIGSDNYIKKRIYTIDEANKVSGYKNSVKIKYK